jgi:hypothetical protein
MYSWEQYEAEAKADYLRWKASQVVENVEINLATTGITPEDAQKIELCFQLKRSFALYNVRGYVLIEPSRLVLIQDGVVMGYKTEKQLQNAIKLLLFSFNKVYVPVKQIR